MILKKYRHAPAHLFIDDQIYFFTGAVYQKRWLLKTEKAKEIFIEQLFRFHDKFNWKLIEWVVLDNHYHFLSEVTQSSDMPKMINTLHKTSAFHIMRQIEIRIKPFWYQYWDRCIRDADHFYRTAMYILHNPVKHGLIDDMQDYRFSSYTDRFGENPEAWQRAFLIHRPDQMDEYREDDDF